MVICRASLSLLKSLFKKMIWYKSLIVLISTIVNSGCVIYMRWKFNIYQLQNFFIYLDALITSIGLVGVLVLDLTDYFPRQTVARCLLELVLLLPQVFCFVFINFINATSRYVRSRGHALKSSFSLVSFVKF